MFPPWPSCLGGPGDPCRGPAVLSVWPLPESEARSRLLSSPASGQRRALPTPPGRELELLPPQMPRPAWPCGLACATREGGVLRRQNATRSGTRRARRSRPLAQPCVPWSTAGSWGRSPPSRLLSQRNHSKTGRLCEFLPAPALRREAAVPSAGHLAHTAARVVSTRACTAGAVPCVCCERFRKACRGPVKPVS